MEFEIDLQKVVVEMMAIGKKIFDKWRLQKRSLPQKSPLRREIWPKDFRMFRTMTVKKKILSGFALVIFLVVLMSSITYYELGAVTRESQERMQQNLYKVELAEELAVDVANQAVAMRRFNFTGVLADVAAFEDHRKYGDDKIVKLESLLSSEQSKAILADLKKAKTEFDTIAAKSIAAKRNNNTAEVALLMQQAGDPSEKAIAMTKQLVSAVKAYIRTEEEKSMETAKEVQLLLVLISLLVAALAVVISIYISNGIARPTNRIAAAAAEIAEGNLTGDDFTMDSSDEIGHLGQSFNQMKGNLQSLLSKVNQAAAKVASLSEQLTGNAEQSAKSSGQVAGASMSVAQGAEQQQLTVNETAAAVQQMAAGVQLVVNNVNRVAEKTSEAAKQATDGGKAVGQAIDQMERIEAAVTGSAVVVAKLGTRSQEIGEIVQTISGIASQTNLLALNVAIEAARAGDQGRGFAVVAEEVRKLAEQSQGAAKQIAALIGEIQTETAQAVKAMDSGTEEVELGTEAVNLSGQTFKIIEELVQDVSSQVTEVSAAVEQIASGTKQIVRAMSRLDTLSHDAVEKAQTVSAATQEQSAVVEEIASSSQILAGMAQELHEVVGHFRLKA